MTQIDWEKMKEEAKIINAVAGTEFSPWVFVQNEYSILNGMYIDGIYTDTQIIDDSFETYSENSITSLSETTFIDGQSFEFNWPPSGWGVTLESNWGKDSYMVYDGTYSAHFYGQAGGTSGYLTSPIMDCSDANSLFVDFWWYDRGLDNDDFELEFYNGNTWIIYQDLNQFESGNGWHHYTETINDIQYFIYNFQIRLSAKTIRSGELACIDLVTVIKNSGINSPSLNLIGSFDIDFSEFSREYIRTLEIQLRYRANDSNERWYLNAYNWEESEYSNIGFNNSIGQIPTTNWDIYSINIVDIWQNYVHTNGTIKVQFIDQRDIDFEQTMIDIDFLGIKMLIDGTNLTFENDGGFTVHFVSLWIIDGKSHEHYDIDIFVNSAITKNHFLYGIMLPEENYVIKTVTERGNVVVYSES